MFYFSVLFNIQGCALKNVSQFIDFLVSLALINQSRLAQIWVIIWQLMWDLLQGGMDFGYCSGHKTRVMYINVTPVVTLPQEFIT